MAVTRIKNNQITDLTVYAAAKLQDYTVTSGKIANDLVYGSNLTVTGNLTVQGNVTTIETHDLVVEDPLILLAKDQTGTPSLDIGYIGERGNLLNIAWIWNESASEFAGVYTSDFSTNTVVNINSYANLHVLDITAQNANITGNITFSGNIVGDFAVTGNVDAGNFVTTGNVDAGNVNITYELAATTANITNDVYIGGNIIAPNSNLAFQSGIFYGDDPTGNNALYAGATGFTFLGSNVVMQVTGNSNSYSQINFENVNSGDAASTDYVATADNGDDSTYFINMGITSSTHEGDHDGWFEDDNTFNAGYVYVVGNGNYTGEGQGSNLYLGSTDGVVKVFVGNTNVNNVVATFNNSGVVVPGNISAGNVIINAAFTSNTISANTITGGNIWSSGNIQGANLVANSGVYTNTVSATSISATGNIDGANLVATAGVFGNTVLANTITATVEVVGANVTANNVMTANVVTSNTASVLGNITGGNLVSNAAIVGNALTVNGDALITGNLTIEGNLTYINIDDLRVEDPIIMLGTGPNGNVLVTNDGRDRGTELVYYSTLNSQQQAAFMGWDNSTGNMVIAANVTVANDVVTVVQFGTFQAGNAYLESLTVAGNLDAANVNATYNVTGTTLTASGNVNGNNVVSTNDVTTATVTASGNVSANNVSAGNNITGITVTATGNLVGGNANITSGVYSATVDATGNITGNNVIANTAVYSVDITASGNITGNNITSNNLISTVTLNASGNVLAANLNSNNFVTGVTLSASGNVIGNNVNSNNDVSTVTVTASGNISANNAVITYNVGANTVTANTITANTSVTANAVIANVSANIGNIRIAGDDITGVNGIVTFNSAGADVDFVFSGNSEANLLVVDATTDTVNVGTATPTVGASFKVGTTDSLLVPVGNTAQRPGTPVQGMLRFNTTLNDLEFYDNDSWNGTKEDITVIVDNSFTGDNSTVVYVLTQDSTTASSLVSINGVLQIPTTAYAVSGNVLTFTEPPADGDQIDVRIMTTTTEVVRIQNTPGNASVEVNPAISEATITANVTYFTGAIEPTGNATANIGSASNLFNRVWAVSTSAVYSDLAEMYRADADYAPGTVLSFGGEQEVTISTIPSDARVAGVVSTNPSYLMNSSLDGDHVVALALTGRVPTRVTGTVRKGDMMVSNGDGSARAEPSPRVGTVIGKALENFPGGQGIIEIVVGRL